MILFKRVSTQTLWSRISIDDRIKDKIVNVYSDGHTPDYSSDDCFLFGGIGKHSQRKEYGDESLDADGSVPNHTAHEYSLTGKYYNLTQGGRVWPGDDQFSDNESWRTNDGHKQIVCCLIEKLYTSRFIRIFTGLEDK